MTRGVLADLLVLDSYLVLGGCPIRRLPNAGFDAAPLTVHFTYRSNPSTAPIRAWEWDSGDGASVTEANPTLIHAHPRLYTVSLTGATSRREDTASVEDCIRVSDGAEGEGEGDLSPPRAPRPRISKAPFRTAPPLISARSSTAASIGSVDGR